MRLMSQLQQDQSSAPANPPPNDDPLARLHKMSTTAGLGSTDYVAVNPTAIFAVIVGLASAFTLFEEPILLIIPLVGAIASIVAFRQIARSNGTQTGKGLAMIALLLCIGFGSLVAARAAISGSREKQNKAALDTTIRKLSDVLVKKDFAAAYQMFDERFRTRVTQQVFQDTMQGWLYNNFYGDLKAITWRHLAEFQVDDTTGTELAACNLIFNYTQAGEVRQDAIFRKINNQWTLEDIPSFFPTKKPGEQ
ncbi:MAG TPA: DUF4190 domain-containing protein [Tepidisphaeraceae bacterium]|jgi:hypothetical protein